MALPSIAITVSGVSMTICAAHTMTVVVGPTTDRVLAGSQRQVAEGGRTRRRAPDVDLPFDGERRFRVPLEERQAVSAALCRRYPEALARFAAPIRLRTSASNLPDLLSRESVVRFDPRLQRTLLRERIARR